MATVDGNLATFVRTIYNSTDCRLSTAGAYTIPIGAAPIVYDTVAPTISIVSPTPGVAPGQPGGFPADLTTAKNTPIVIDITDVNPGIQLIVVTARFPNSDIAETVYRSGNFCGNYAGGSTQTTITNGLRLSCKRYGGWPSTTRINFDLDVIDMVGNRL